MKRDTALFAAALLFGLATTSTLEAAEPAAECQRLQDKKTGLEIAKLGEEVRELQATSLAIGRSTKLWTTWLAAGGSAATTLLVAVVGFFLNRTQNRRVRQEHEFAREKHFLEVFKSLGDTSEGIRLGGVGILLERIDRLYAEGAGLPGRNKPGTRWGGDTMGAQNVSTLVSILVNITKTEPSEIVQKYVADGLVRALGARIEDGTKPKTKTSPLAEYDFQGAKLSNAWWAHVDAREVDLYGATLVRAGMKGAFLGGAVLKYAKLHKAVLRQADLRGAILVAADLREADLRGATLDGADLTQADLSQATLTEGALANAKTDGAKLVGVIFTPKPIPACEASKGLKA